MERINVSEAWRMRHNNTTFKMGFDTEADMTTVIDAMKAAIKSFNYDDIFEAVWIQDLSDCETAKSLEFDSALECNQFMDYIPEMIKAAANTLPHGTFNGIAFYEDQRCFWNDEFEFSFDGSELRIKETFMDDTCGYFCPECGSVVVFADMGTPEPDEIFECEECEKSFKASELNYVAPEVKEEVIRIR